ncbi:MAG: hypothetical protein LBK73_09720, partial [Treponema sp.]|nr:hypothetical protein [Treponema sp.]
MFKYFTWGKRGGATRQIAPGTRPLGLEEIVFLFELVDLKPLCFDRLNKAAARRRPGMERVSSHSISLSKPTPASR